MTQKSLYIGLLSGTSVDSIDVAVCEISNNSFSVKATHSHPIDSDIKKNLHALIANQNSSIKDLGELNRKLGILFAQAVNTILKQNNLKATDITAIGFHGQTIFHQPQPPYNFSWQLGCANSLTEQTQIPVVTDFRQRDMINNGQGAPLAPVFHEQVFKKPGINRAIVNIGGISNISLLVEQSSEQNFIGTDVGPGNTLLDLYYRKNHSNSTQDFDKNGEWAQSGTVNEHLLAELLADSYFKKPWPKSTGREYFNLAWLDAHLSKLSLALQPADIQRTLLELTATIIADSVISYNQSNSQYKISEVYLCGGGAHNKLLFARISELLAPVSVNKTDVLNIPADWVEAALFAWLGYCTWNKQKLKLNHITGNKNSETMLGCVYF